MFRKFKAISSKLVITSTWRKSKTGIETLLKNLKEYDLDTEVIGYTPILNTNREIEIKQYLSSYEEQPNFIILDDDVDFSDLIPYLIRTDLKLGLTSVNVEDVIKKLSKVFITSLKILIKKEKLVNIVIKNLKAAL